MFLTSTVEIQYYIEKNNLEVNPNTEYSTRKDFIEKVNSRDVNGDWTYIHFPDDGNQPIVDLSGFISFWSADISKLLPYSVTPDATELKRLRLYCYSAYTDSMFVIDLNYVASAPDYYRLDNVIVYDERSDTFYKEEYTIKGSTTGYATLMLDTINMVMEVTMQIESNRINNAIGDPNIGGIQC